jgi:N-acetyl-1-D-myo-inositol-2-amino-2-deoxy-alpha-D-glucopyranoside deacetylase
MHDVLAGLTAGAADQLGGYRLAELGAACRALGVTDRRMLGGLGRFRDSGMVGTPSANHPRAFCRAGTGGADHGEAVAALREVLDEMRPAVVLTYDADGGYGHPDHIAAHQVTAAAVQQWRATEAGSGCRLMAVVKPRSELAAALDALWAGELPPGYHRPRLADLGYQVDDDAVDLTLPVGAWRTAKRAAMRAHATQLDVWAGELDGYALTNLLAQPVLAAEHFQLLSGPGVPAGATDLFAGL